MNKQLAAFLRQFESTGSPEADRYLGCHAVDEGFVFRVWAPHAQAVSVTGDFNFWNEADLPMQQRCLGGRVEICKARQRL